MGETTGGDVMVQVLQAVTELRTSFEGYAKRTDERFEQIDRRFDQIDLRFVQVDLRFEQIDRRFERMEQRIDSLEGHAMLTNHRLNALESFAVRTDKRLAEMAEHNRRTDERLIEMAENNRRTNEHIVQILQSLTDVWKLSRRLEQGLARLDSAVEQLADTCRLRHRDHEERLLTLEKQRA